jgi:RHS repeat-associated protein
MLNHFTRLRFGRLCPLVVLSAVLGVPAPASAQSETIEYYGLDALGSVRVIFDQQGNVVDRMDYDPFGANLRAAIKFPSEQFAQLAREGESEQDYAETRHYLPLAGRLNRTDSVFAGLFKPQQWNRYAYALNAPLNYIDPDGRNPILGVGTTTLGIIAAHEAGAFDPNRSTTATATVSSEAMYAQPDEMTTWENIKWGITQIVDMLTITRVNGSDVPGEDERIPTKRDTPSNTTQVVVAVAGVATVALPGKPVSRILFRTPRSLQKGFVKHGADFGLAGKWNPKRAADFSAAVHRHINDVDTMQIVGQYRGSAAIHHVNPVTGLNVVTTIDGHFVTGYQLTQSQLQGVLTKGWLW